MRPSSRFDGVSPLSLAFIADLALAPTLEDWHTKANLLGVR